MRDTSRPVFPSFVYPSCRLAGTVLRSRRRVVEKPSGVPSLSSLQNKLAEVVLVKCPMCFGGLVKRKAPRDMDLERR